MWFQIFVLLCVVTCAVAKENCLILYSVDGDLLDVFVDECAKDFGKDAQVAQIEPNRYKYYLLQSHNGTRLTTQWISSITQNIHHSVANTPSSFVVAVEIMEEDRFIASLPSAVEIVHITTEPRVAIASSKLTLLKELAKTAMIPNDLIQDLVSQVNEADLRSFVEYLSGELSGSPILTRNSISAGAPLAAAFIEKQFTEFGYQTSTQCYRTGYSCNVIANLPGTTLPDEVIILGAHYDSRASDLSSPTQRAPGANDDGSGTGTLLQIAKIISQSNAKFARTIRFVTFSGEEQGLYGSQAYATEMVNTKTNVVAMIQNDMIAYRAPSTDLLCGFPLTYTTPELTSIAISATHLYSPTVSTGRNSRCCSDHRSFNVEGFATTDFSDTHGPIVDPEYHSSGDLVNRPGFDFEKYVAIVKGIFATVAVVAQPL